MDEQNTISVADESDLSAITDWSDLPEDAADDSDVAAEAEGDTADATPATADKPEGDTEKTDTQPAEKADTAPEKQTEADQSFTLKYLGEEKVVTRDEVIVLAQKGMDYDRQKAKYDALVAEHAKPDEGKAFIEELAKARGLSVQDFIDQCRAQELAQRESIDESVALARVKLERKEREIAAREAELKTAADKAKTDAATQEKFRQDFLEFAQAYPNVGPDEIPQSVWESVAGGVSLKAAYKGYQDAQEAARIKAENEALKAELAAVKKQQDNKTKSTGSKATAGNSTAGDPWLADLESRF